MVINNKEKKTVSFKEVHRDLELESQFTRKEHDISSFKRKGDFLNKLGFVNSIATKIYNDIANKNNTIAHFKNKYPLYKFIFESQLERVCEKYDLYVREPSMFIGDIPSKNIIDMEKFKIDIDDIINVNNLFIEDTQNINRLSLYSDSASEKLRETGDIFKFITNRYPETMREDFRNEICKLINYNPHSNNYITLNDITRLFESNNKDLSFIFKQIFRIEIAAVKSLLSPEAFEKSESRIINKPEVEAKSQVDLDPVVLLKVPQGYFIITAWGDESNDELILNEKLN